jgi:hypothetical protein
MYAYKTKQKLEKDVDFTYDTDEAEEIAYWRKHPDLHGWMEELYRNKGGAEDSFNCVPVKLTQEDLVALEADINTRHLPETSGFFFGKSYGDTDEVMQDIEFVEKAKQAINEGYDVYYTSWW